MQNYPDLYKTYTLLAGASIGVKCAVIVGGMDMVAQSLMLSKKPHIIIATPGRLVDHLENTKGFNLKALKFLVSFIKLLLTLSVASDRAPIFVSFVLVYRLSNLS